MTARRILVLDDYPDASEAIATLLGVLGHDVRIARSGHGALELARGFSAEIALVDIGLPDITGYEVARELRALAAGRPLFLVAMTGWGQPEDRMRALAAGFDLHQLKPVDAAVLRRVLALADTQLAGRPGEGDA